MFRPQGEPTRKVGSISEGERKGIKKDLNTVKITDGFLLYRRSAGYFNMDVFWNEITFNALLIEENICVAIEYFPTCVFVEVDATCL